MKTKIKIAIVNLLLCCFSALSFAGHLLFVAEELPPFHYLDENKKPTGVLVDIVQAMFEAENIEAHIKLMAFAPGYNLTLKDKNVFMFSLLKTPDRQAKFQWIGQTYNATAFLVGLKDRADIKIANLNDAKKLVVGTIRGYHSERFLKDEGFTLGNNLYLTVRYEQMWGMLFKGRIDLILTNFVALELEMKSIGLNIDDIKPYIELHDFPGELHIATGLATPKATVLKLQKALQIIKTNGTYQKIMSKWNLVQND